VGKNYTEQAWTSVKTALPVGIGWGMYFAKWLDRKYQALSANYVNSFAQSIETVCVVYI
jgi:hypothetical protein